MIAWQMLEPRMKELLLGARQFTGTLPSRLTQCQEYEHGTETYIAGTSYLAKSGTWHEAAPGITSSEPGATISYRFTGCSVGVEWWYAEFYPPQYVDYRIDGGPWQVNQPMSGNGLTVAPHGQHVIEYLVRPGMTFTIDHFLAV